MSTRADAERYLVEPYLVAADIAAHPGRVGRGGWTWYTGSAGWITASASRRSWACAAEETCSR